MRNDEEEEDPPSSRRIGVGLSVEEALDEIAVELFLFPNNRRLSSPRQPRPPPRQRLDRWCCCPCGCFLAGEMFFAPPTRLLQGARTSPTPPRECTHIRIFFLSLKLFRVAGSIEVLRSSYRRQKRVVVALRAAVLVLFSRRRRRHYHHHHRTAQQSSFSEDFRSFFCGVTLQNPKSGFRKYSGRDEIRKESAKRALRCASSLPLNIYTRSIHRRIEYRTS